MSQPAANNTTVELPLNWSEHIHWYEHLNDSNDTYHVTGPPIFRELPHWAQVVLIAAYTVSVILSLLGNGIVIYQFASAAKTSEISRYLVNLALSDMLMAVFCMPFTFTQGMLGRWVFGTSMCPLVLFVQLMSVSCSVLTLLAIGVDRYLAVMYPFESHLTRHRSIGAIIITWIISVTLGTVHLFFGRAGIIPKSLYQSSGSDEDDDTPPLACYEHWPDPAFEWQRGFTVASSTVLYFIPLLLLAFLYSAIGIHLWKRNAPGNSDESRDYQLLISKRKTIKMLVAVVLAFGLSWLPLNVFFLVSDLDPEIGILLPLSKYYFLYFYVCHWLAMAHCFMNPIIYGFSSGRLLRSFRECVHSSRHGFHTHAESEMTLLVKDSSRYRPSEGSLLHQSESGSCSTAALSEMLSLQ